MQGRCEELLSTVQEGRGVERHSEALDSRLPKLSIYNRMLSCFREATWLICWTDQFRTRARAAQP